MESLQNLIEQIKEEGVLSAKNESLKIVEEAKNNAEAVKSAAIKEAEEIVRKAETEAEKFRNNAEKTIEHAGRNLILAVRAEIEKIFGVIIKEKTGEALTPSLLKDTIVKLVENWQKTEKGKKSVLEILVNEKDIKQLESLFLGALSAKMKSGVEIKPVNGIKKGFMVGEKGTGIYYDITDAGIAESLQSYLNPKLRKLIENIKIS